eukprot:TRINITY_DN122415_c0_g1_i1.p1 TRINITY_DN122415_c0_g1~~TRINITY_DN122415_c0_g1_i1.p1  ORF type:complete len:326 (-),score=65.54 TRINITY_DN122415_c0_g1_i1:157-1134(-)
MSSRKAVSSAAGASGEARFASRAFACFKDVWRQNVHEEMMQLRELVEEYPFVACDAVSPGGVAQPLGLFDKSLDYHYQEIKLNVDLTRLVQLSFTLCDENGNHPMGTSTWRFNFKFDADTDLVGQQALSGMRQSGARGVNFHLNLELHREHGIEQKAFAELLHTSGFVCLEDVRWVTFCGAKELSDKYGKPDGLLPKQFKYHEMFVFGHMLRMLTGTDLPEDREGFYETLALVFPRRFFLCRHLQSVPYICDTDPRDPQLRPQCCFAEHLLDAYCSLPQSVKGDDCDGSGDDVVSLQETRPAPATNGKTKKGKNGNQSNRLVSVH